MEEMKEIHEVKKRQHLFNEKFRSQNMWNVFFFLFFLLFLPLFIYFLVLFYNEKDLMK